MHSLSSCVFLPSHLVYSQPASPMYSTAWTSQAGALVHCPHPQIKQVPSVADITGLCNSPAGLPAHHQPGCYSGHVTATVSECPGPRGGNQSPALWTLPPPHASLYSRKSALAIKPNPCTHTHTDMPVPKTPLPVRVQQLGLGTLTGFLQAQQARGSLLRDSRCLLFFPPPLLFILPFSSTKHNCSGSQCVAKTSQ